MYLLLLFVLLAASAMLARAGYSKRRAPQVWAGALIGVAAIGFFSMMSFWGEALWFHAVGFGPRFWTFVEARAATLAARAPIGLLGVAMLNTLARRLRPMVSPWIELAGAAVGAAWGLGAWNHRCSF